MKMLLVACLAALASPALSKCVGSINVKDFGEVFIVAPDWSVGAVTIHDNGFTLRGNSRIYFASRCDDGWNGDMYAQFPLADKHFAYQLDMSNVPCHCNAAAYFVDMPGNNAGDGDYYCDANHGNNIWCPEYDVMEGNKHTMACTLHTCSGGNGNWDYCDGGGCQQNAWNAISGQFGPGKTINTDQSFTVSHFQNSGQANTWMGQGGNDASFNMCNDGGYVSNMAQSYGDMVFTASLWGGGGIDMGWLDGMTGCGGECNIDSASVTMTNFELWA